MDEKTQTEKSTPMLERLFAVGAHFAYSRSRRHPSVAPYIFGTKNKVELFDLEKVSTLLAEAKQFVEGLGKERKKILFVGGKNEAQRIVKTTALELEMPYVAGRWIGGTLTNFSEIQKRIKRLGELRERKEKGEFETRYTKRERLMFDREITDLEVHFGGLLSLAELPAALIVVDPRHEHTAVREANKLEIPVVALLNSDCNMGVVQHPIVGNDSAYRSIGLFLKELFDAYKSGLSHAHKTEDPAKDEIASDKGSAGGEK